MMTSQKGKGGRLKSKKITKKVILCFIQIDMSDLTSFMNSKQSHTKILFCEKYFKYFFFSDPNKNEDDTWVPDQGGPFWPVYSGTKREFLRIASNNNSRGAGMKSQECHFWSTYLPQLLRKGSLLHYSSFE